MTEYFKNLKKKRNKFKILKHNLTIYNNIKQYHQLITDSTNSLNYTNSNYLFIISPKIKIINNNTKAISDYRNYYFIIDYGLGLVDGIVF